MGGFPLALVRLEAKARPCLAPPPSLFPSSAVWLHWAQRARNCAVRRSRRLLRCSQGLLVLPVRLQLLVSSTPGQARCIHRRGSLSVETTHATRCCRIDPLAVLRLTALVRLFRASRFAPQAPAQDVLFVPLGGNQQVRSLQPNLHRRAPRFARLVVEAALGVAAASAVCSASELLGPVSCCGRSEHRRRTLIAGPGGGFTRWCYAAAPHGPSISQPGECVSATAARSTRHRPLVMARSPAASRLTRPFRESHWRRRRQCRAELATHWRGWR